MSYIKPYGKVCFHCNQLYDLHNYVTDQCPLPKKEGDGWCSTTFLDVEVVKLEKAAPELAQCLREVVPFLEESRRLVSNRWGFKRHTTQDTQKIDELLTKISNLLKSIP